MWGSVSQVQISSWHWKTKISCVVSPTELQNTDSNDDPACNWSKSVGAAASWHWQVKSEQQYQAALWNVKSSLTANRQSPACVNEQAAQCVQWRIKVWPGRQLFDLIIRWTRPSSCGIVIKHRVYCEINSSVVLMKEKDNKPLLVAFFTNLLLLKIIDHQELFHRNPVLAVWLWLLAPARWLAAVIAVLLSDIHIEYIK